MNSHQISQGQFLMKNFIDNFKLGKLYQTWLLQIASIAKTRRIDYCCKIYQERLKYSRHCG